MAEFDPAFWTNANAKRAQINTADAERSAGQFFATRDAARSGMGFMNSMREGMKNREAVFDPMFALKQSEMQANIAGRAMQIQEGILSSQIKKAQIDDEAADNLAFSKVAGLKTWEEKANALNTIVPKSARGIQQANMMRLQLTQLRMSDYTSRAMTSIAQKNPALALRISAMEQGSPEWIAAIEEGAAIDNKPQGIAITLPSGKTVEAVYNAKGGGYTLVQDQAEKLKTITETLGAKEKSALSVFYNKEAAKLEAEASGLERSARETDKKAAAALREEAASYRKKLEGFSSPVPATAPTPSTTPKITSRADFDLRLNQYNSARKLAKSKEEVSRLEKLWEETGAAAYARDNGIELKTVPK